MSSPSDRAKFEGEAEDEKMQTVNTSVKSKSSVPIPKLVTKRYCCDSQAVVSLMEDANGWIKDNPQDLAHFWKHNRLFKHVRIARDDEGEALGESDGGIIIAGLEDYRGRFHGLRLSECTNYEECEAAEDLVEDGKAIFAVHPDSAQVSTAKRHSKSSVYYDSPKLLRLHYTNLESEIFDERDHYQMLSPYACDYSGDCIYWSAVMRNGDEKRREMKRRAAELSAKASPPVSAHDRQAIKAGEKNVELFPREQMKVSAGILKNDGHCTYSIDGVNTIGGSVGGMTEVFRVKAGGLEDEPTDKPQAQRARFAPKHNFEQATESHAQRKRTTPANNTKRAAKSHAQRKRSTPTDNSEQAATSQAHRKRYTPADNTEHAAKAHAQRKSASPAHDLQQAAELQAQGKRSAPANDDEQDGWVDEDQEKKTIRKKAKVSQQEGEPLEKSTAELVVNPKETLSSAARDEKAKAEMRERAQAGLWKVFTG